MLAKNIISQVDDKGRHQILINEIIDHIYSGGTLTKAKGGWGVTQNGTTNMKITIRAQDLYIQCQDSSGDWVSLKYMREKCPLYVADYKNMAGIDNEL